MKDTAKLLCLQQSTSIALLLRQKMKVMTTDLTPNFSMIFYWTRFIILVIITVGCFRVVPHHGFDWRQLTDADGTVGTDDDIYPMIVFHAKR